MKVLLIGSGGREHAMAWKLAESSRVTELFVAPGNAGTSQIAENVAIDPLKFKEVEKFVRLEIQLLIKTSSEKCLEIHELNTAGDALEQFREAISNMNRYERGHCS